MVYLSLYRKYRPQTFKDILGQEHVSRTLSNAISEDRVAHAYLFTGPRGTGKTSTARILAKALNCERGPTPEPCGVCSSCVAIAEGSSMDVIEMDAASHSKVEETRDILAGVALATAGSRKKVYVIDEVHMLTTQSFNALLKTLEEPPEHVVFVLATTEAHKVLPTIVSRTQRFDFRRVPTDAIEDHLSDVAKRESIAVDPAALSLVARHAEGSVRDALSVLDQLSSVGANVSVEDAERLMGERSEDAYIDLFDAVSGGDVGGVFTTIDRLVSQGADVRQLASGVLQHARDLVLAKTSPGAEGLIDIADEDRAAIVEQAERFGGAALLRLIDLVSSALTEMRNVPNHRLLLEVALIRAAAPDTDPAPAGLLGRIERLERRLAIDGAPQGATGPAVPAAREQPLPAGPLPSVRPPPADPASPAADDSAATPMQSAPDTPQAPPASDEERVFSAPARGDIGVGHIRDAWPATMAEVNRASRRVGAYLNPSQPLRFEGDALVIEVRSPFHADEMSKPSNKDTLVEALHAALGIRPAVAFVHQGSAVPVQSEQPEESIDLDEMKEVDVPDPVELVKKGLKAEFVEEIEKR